MPVCIAYKKKRSQLFTSVSCGILKTAFSPEVIFKNKTYLHSVCLNHQTEIGLIQTSWGKDFPKAILKVAAVELTYPKRGLERSLSVPSLALSGTHLSPHLLNSSHFYPYFFFALLLMLISAHCYVKLHIYLILLLCTLFYTCTLSCEIPYLPFVIIISKLLNYLAQDTCTHCGPFFITRINAY